MGYFVPLALVALHFTTALAIQGIPFKCFLQEPMFNGIFKQTSSLPRPYTIPNNPLAIETMTVDAVTLDKDGFRFDTKEIEVKGIKDTVLDNINLDFASNVTRVSLRMDITATSRYRTEGSLFFLPIEGEGIWTTDLKNVQIYVVIPTEIIETNGVKRADLKSYTFWYDVRDNAKFHLSNLYYGNQESSDAMHNLINQNWKLITVQFGGPFIDRFVSSMFKEFRNYFLSIPLRDFSSC